MNNELQTFVFDYGDKPWPQRKVERDGDPWFVAKDACTILSIQNVSQAVAALDEDEKGICLTYTLGGEQETLIVSEGGLYTLILRSRDAVTPGTMPHAFRRWVTGTLLPQIRKTGRYAPNSDERFADMDPAFRLALFREFRLAKTAGQKRLLVDMHPVLADYLDLPPPAPAAAGASSVGLDYVRTFLSERTVEAPGGRVNSTVLFQAFEAWAKTQYNVPPMTHTAFALTLNRLGVRKANYEGRKFYLGIRIRHTLEIEGEG